MTRPIRCERDGVVRERLEFGGHGLLRDGCDGQDDGGPPRPDHDPTEP